MTQDISMREISIVGLLCVCFLLAVYLVAVVSPRQYIEAGCYKEYGNWHCPGHRNYEEKQ